MTDFGVGVDFGEYPGFLPGTAVAIVVAVFLAGGVARRLDASRSLAWLLVASFGTIIAVTLTPGRGAPMLDLPAATVGCDLTRVGPAGWADYAQFGDAAFNVLLFTPLGVAIGLIAGLRPRTWLLLGAVILPFAIEGIQLAVAPLGRACQGGDVSDNLIGLGIGVAASGAWSVLHRLR